MLRITSLIFALLVSWSACAQVPLTGAGKGAPGGGATYQGPGDVFTTTPLAAYSCAEAFTAAYASSNGNACDLVDSAAPTTVICTLKFLTTGLVDLASASCTGAVTPATKCAAATGGTCNISKAYNQISPGTLDAIQATAANQPKLAFNSTPTGTLPAINCGTGAVTQQLLTSGTLTQAQPLTLSGVYIRNSGTAAGGLIGGPIGTSLFFGAGGAALGNINFGASLNASATDNAWHSLEGLANGIGTSSAINVDGSDTTGSAGTTGFSANAIALCRVGGNQLGGLIAEGMIWGASTTPTNRNAISANQHSAGRYNF